MFDPLQHRAPPAIQMTQIYEYSKFVRIHSVIMYCVITSIRYIYASYCIIVSCVVQLFGVPVAADDTVCSAE